VVAHLFEQPPDAFHQMQLCLVVKVLDKGLRMCARLSSGGLTASNLFTKAMLCSPFTAEGHVDINGIQCCLYYLYFRQLWQWMPQFPEAMAPTKSCFSKQESSTQSETHLLIHAVHTRL
jgi:hypothetical protein